MDTAPGDCIRRRTAVGALVLAHARRAVAWLLGVVALGLGPVLVLPASAPASKQSSAARKRAPAAAFGGSEGGLGQQAPEPGGSEPGETSPVQESTAGESPAPPLESPTIPGEPPSSSGESPPTSGESTPRKGVKRAALRMGSCRLAIAVAPRRVVAGETATVSGSLSCPGSATTAEQSIVVYQKTAGAPGYDPVATLTPDEGGGFDLTTEALDADSVFYARAQDAQGAPGVRSRPMHVNVAPLVTIGVPSAQMQLSLPGRRAAASKHASNTVTFSGTVSPSEAGAAVVLQREGRGMEESWQRIGVGQVDARGDYSITHTFGIAGLANVRVIVRAHGLQPGTSEPLSLTIAPRQNPQLTLQAEPQPFTYGQALTLGGVAAGGAGQPLTLLQSSEGGPFAPVASTVSEAGGRYQFSGHSPARDTRYEVSDAHAHSKKLFVGVRPQVSLQASASSVQSGEPVLFGGVLTPARAGASVDLERQDPSGLGYHIVQAATVAGDGSFSFEHVVSGNHGQLFRAIVPGGEGMQGGASAPLEIGLVLPQGVSLEGEAPTASPG